MQTKQLPNFSDKKKDNTQSEQDDPIPPHNQISKEVGSAKGSKY
jgi:hypothetical protein